MIQRYAKKVKSEFQEICNEVLQLLETVLIPEILKLDDSTVERVFYMKMKADYYSVQHHLR